MITGGRVGVAVVVPVRNGGGHLDACIGSLSPELDRMGGELIVVDDASSDGTATRAEDLGARVVRFGQQRGPYAARNAGWRATAAPVVVFTDVRNRAADGWLAALVDAMGDDAVAIAGGQVEIGGDGRLAHRLARKVSHVDPEPLLADPFLGYVTTSSMAVRRTVLEALGGFDERRSGGDADLCWRAQLGSHGSVVAAPESRMRCQPRESVIDNFRQWRRYAVSHVELRHRFAPHGARSREPASRRVVVALVVRAVERAIRRQSSDPILDIALSLRQALYHTTLRSSLRKVARSR